MPLSRLCLTLLLLLALSSAFAQDGTWRVSASAMMGQTWLGSEDMRRGGYYSLSYARHEPRLHFWGYDAEIDVEAYYMFTKGGAQFIAGPNSSHHYGVLLIGRYFQRHTESTRAFVEGGLGLQFTNRLTHDIDKRMNSTPMIGAGVLVPFRDMELMLSMRYFHISNAGTGGGNEGLNFFQFQAGLRF